MRTIIVTKLQIINLPRSLCQWLVGEEHKISHRMFAGMTVMAVGVGIAKSAHATEVVPLQFSLDLTGYLIHGLGAVPFIDWLITKKE